MVSFKLFLILFGLATEAFATATPSVVCATDLGTKLVKNVPTKTVTSSKKITIIKKIIRRVNIVIVPVVMTTTRTAQLVTTIKTAAPDTKTAARTVTSKFTISSTRTDTATITKKSTTITTKFITSTVPAPAGFTAILNAPGYVAKREVKENLKLQAIDAGKRYPQRVRCVNQIPTTSIRIVSTTVQGARVTLKATTKTKTSTVIKTTTSTKYPSDLSTTTTKTVSSHTTVWTDDTTTTTVTETVTVESQVPGEAIYDACASNNILLTANDGGRVYEWTDVTADNNPTGFGGGYTPSRCCAECAQRPTCRISLFDTTDANCYIYLAGDSSICANGQQPMFGKYLTNKNTPAKPHWIYSNGPCGQLKNGGDPSGTGIRLHRRSSLV
ncbi:hypothetical protein FALBO_15980 [Fusarium albosuccineum]|uniref:Apple domain-containing protein n=1 Tax=Fusarium albosuccineum TaxID=1237068 RepID=A0A8H4KPZ2_9HYPO|nr:hypothetical protein FALBO_15980 [Fusarium albosuccineum]